jgi:Bifunctional DNA primase/polymerase, N-terminal
LNPAESTAREVAVALGVGVFPVQWIKKDGKCSCGKKDCKDPGKHPLTAHGLSEATTDLEQIDRWAAKWPKANWAMVPGDKYVITDRDLYKEAGATSSAALEKQFPGLFDSTVAATTPRGGCHDLFELPPGEIVSSKNNALGDGLDVKSRGGYVLLPGSRTDAGIYAWKPSRSWKDRPPEPVPPELLALLPRPARKEAKPKHRPFAKPLYEAMKRDPLAAYHKATGQAEFAKRGDEYYFICPSHEDTKPSARLNPDKGWCCDVCGAGGGIAEVWAARFKLDPVTDFDRIERELADLFEVKLSDADAPKKSKVAEMLELLKARNIQPFSDSNDDTYVDFVTLEGLRDTQRISAFGRYCTFLYYRATGKTISAATIQEVLSHLDAEARYGGNQSRNPTLRYGGDGNTIYVNLGRADKKILRIATDGLSVIEYMDCPVCFLFPKGQLDLPLPGKTPMALSEIHSRFYSNMGERAFLLTMGWTLGAMRRADEYHHLFINDAPDRGKTEVAKSQKLLIDPTTRLVRNYPRDPRDLFASLRNDYLPVYDNGSSITADASDVLASIGTGGDLVQRKLYEDSDEISVGGAHPVGVTGVPAMARRPDLAARVLNPTLERFADCGGTAPRIEAKTFRADFMAARADILATLWAALSAGLRETVELPENVRMAESALWMYRCLKALGKEEEFLAAYRENHTNTAERLLDESPLYTLILSMVQTCTDDKSNPKKFEYHDFNGTATQLLDQLNQEAATHITHNPKWPKSAWHLSVALSSLESAFRSAGVIINKGERDTKGHNRDRLIHIHHVDDPAYKNHDVPAEHPRELREAI